MQIETHANTSRSHSYYTVYKQMRRQIYSGINQNRPKEKPVNSDAALFGALQNAALFKPILVTNYLKEKICFPGFPKISSI